MRGIERGIFGSFLGRVFRGKKGVKKGVFFFS
jgi:hypothetical protein